MIDNKRLPKDWKWEKLEQIAKWGSGGTPLSTNPAYYNGDIPWLIIGDMNDGYVYTSEKKITKLGLENSSAKLIAPESVLIAMYGSIGKLGINKIPVATNQAIAFTEKLYDNIFNKYLFYYLFHIRSKLHGLGKGGTQKNISQTVLKQVEIPLPPKIKQQKIVSKIEELFSELDKGIEELNKTQQQLKVYKQAVLKWAFDGRLTEHWRKENSVGNAADTLMAIKKKRNELLQTSFSNNQEAGRLLNKIRKHKFKVPELAIIPRDWCWSSFLDACFLIVDCHNKTAPYEDDGIFLIRTSNIKNGKLLLEEKMRFVSEATDKYWSRRCPPQPGDILFTREAPMGEAAIIPNNIRVCMGQRIMLLRTFPKMLSTKYLHYAMMDSGFLRRMNNNAIGTGVKHLRVGDVEELVFPMCSPEEQQQIVQEIESRLSVCDKIEETITKTLQQSETLRQSILKKAFEGGLV